MYKNKIINSNSSYSTMNRTNTNYSNTSLAITISCLINRLSRFYIHNTSRNEQNRFIDLDQRYNSIEIENDENTIYAIVESPPQKIGFSIFYVDSETGSYEAANPTSTESNNSDEKDLYESIAIPPFLPPRNSSLTIPMNTNPNYVSIDDLRPTSSDSEPIYAEILPPLPPRNFMENNPFYAPNDTRSTPPRVPVRTPSFHARFRERFSI